ncbi:hypothetical protein DE146DRAFT_637439 [Phaeosphaeria sp. MPI-PUGE-AT-0046c]|nr:hypothetical protein DE146DRAFT_637439 [Phaeosphaeria sp. MPI-PUGE-AT-0046c]
MHTLEGQCGPRHFKRSRGQRHRSRCHKRKPACRLGLNFTDSTPSYCATVLQVLALQALTDQEPWRPRYQADPAAVALGKVPAYREHVNCGVYRRRAAEAWMQGDNDFFTMTRSSRVPSCLTRAEDRHTFAAIPYDCGGGVQRLSFLAGWLAFYDGRDGAAGLRFDLHLRMFLHSQLPGRRGKAFQMWMVGVEEEDTNGPEKIRSPGPSERQAAEAREDSSLERQPSGSEADEVDSVGTLDCSVNGACNRHAALRLQLLTLRVDRHMLTTLATDSGDSRLSRANVDNPNTTKTILGSEIRPQWKDHVVVLKAENAPVAARLLLADSAIVADWQFPFWRAHYPHRKLAICSRRGSTYEIANFQICIAV